MSPSRVAPPSAPSGRAPRRRAGRPPIPTRLGEVQQAEIVLPPLAHDDLAPLGRDGILVSRSSSRSIWCCRLRVKVETQTGGVLLGPEAGRGEIAERLADTGAGLGQHQVRLVLALARREGEADGRGVVGLLRARSACLAEQLDQARARLGGGDGLGRGRRRARAASGRRSWPGARRRRAPAGRRRERGRWRGAAPWPGHGTAAAGCRGRAGPPRRRPGSAPRPRCRSTRRGRRRPAIPGPPATGCRRRGEPVGMPQPAAT
jgi:hypothetical protein